MKKMSKIIVGFLLGLSISVFGFEQSQKPNSHKNMFLRGGDISMLLKYEELKFSFQSAKQKGNALKVMAGKGCNFFRVRLFVDPTMKNGVIQDLDYVIKMGQLLKKQKVKFLLDIHYSDTWADPGQQAIPKKWLKLSFDDLVKKVENYSSDIISKLHEAGCPPDMVQVGNEITHGMLWPYGKIYSDKGGWDRFTQLLKAGIKGVRRANSNAEIMVHMAPTKSHKSTRNFFDQLKKYEVSYDIIGLSYYPWWHGDISDLKAHINNSAKEQNKPFIIVECAYLYAKKEYTSNKPQVFAGPYTIETQRAFVEELIDAGRETNLGRGVVWWYPESVKLKGGHSWHGGKAALFNEAGKALPALDSLGNY